METLIGEEQLLRGSEAAVKLRVDSATIRRWRREGAPFEKLGNGLIRYRMSDLLIWRSTRPVIQFRRVPVRKHKDIPIAFDENETLLVYRRKPGVITIFASITLPNPPPDAKPYWTVKINGVPAGQTFASIEEAEAAALKAAQEVSL
jgi:hypothetical protein